MQIAELLVQSVSGLPAQGRWQVPGGHVVFATSTPLLPLLRALLFFDGNPDDGSARLAGAPGARAALTLRGRGGAIWRLVRSLGGGLTLQRWDAPATRWVAVTSAAMELGQMLRAQVGAPSRALFDELFSLDAERLRALLAVPATEVAAAPPPPPPPPPPPQASPPRDEAALAKSIAALERELAAAGEVDELQRRLDATLHDLAAADREKAAIAFAEAQVAAARGELRRFEGIGDLPDDLTPLVRAHRAAEAEREEALRRIADDRSSWEARTTGAAKGGAPPWKDLRFYAAVGLGLAALGTGLLTPARIVALLNVPAFGAAALLGVRWVGRLQAAESLGRVGALLAERERRVEEQWKAAAAPLLEALQRAGVQNEAELEELIRGRAAARAKLAAAEEELERVRARTAAAVERAEALRAEAARLEERIGVLAAGAYRPRAVVERELAAARARLAGEEGPAPLVAGDLPPELLDALPMPGSILGALAAGRKAPPAAAAPQDPTIRLLGHGAEVAAIDLHTIGGRAAPRVGQHLAHLTGGRFTGATLSSTSGLSCAGPGGPVPFGALSGADRALAWIAVQLTLVEMAAARQPAPLIYDDPLALLGDGEQRVICRLLQGLGGRTQVLHRTRLASVGEHADARLEA